MKKLHVISLLVLSSSLFTLCEGQYTILYNFDSAKGIWPAGSLTLSGNKLYVMSQDRGTKGVGNILSIDTDGSSYRDLFDFDTINGAYPVGSLTLVGNKLYGSTSGGYIFGGTIFSIDTNGSNYKDLFDFTSLKGSYPNGSLTFSGGKLFGTSQNGGTHGDGVIFSIDTSGSGFKDLLDFNGANGASPIGGTLTLSENKLFGMARYGGAYDSGCVFTIDTAGNNYKDLMDFNGPNGIAPFATSLVISGNILYGMVTKGGAHDSGCVFSIDTNGSGYSDLLDFNSRNGGNPESALILLGNTLIGTTFDGGANSEGCIFSISTDGNGYTDLFDFDNGNGYRPWDMALTPSGNGFFGTASLGGTNQGGVIFRFKRAGLGINSLPPTIGTINVYPNPSNGVFNLQIRNYGLGINNIEVYNVLGEEVLTEALRSAQGDNAIDLSNQPNGVYLYRVIESNGELIGEGKLVIQK